jgi:hypothetical protein
MKNKHLKKNRKHYVLENLKYQKTTKKGGGMLPVAPFLKTR